MAPGADVDAGLFAESGFAPIEREAALGQSADGIKRGQGSCQGLQSGHVRLQGFEQLFVESVDIIVRR